MSLKFTQVIIPKNPREFNYRAPLARSFLYMMWPDCLILIKAKLSRLLVGNFWIFKLAAA